MKKILLFITALVMAVAADAQQIGITAGLNVSRWNTSHVDRKTGFNIGIKGEYEIAEPFFIEGALLGSRKGLKYDYNEFDNDITTWYLQVPVNFGYKFRINHFLEAAPKCGIYAALGLTGHDDAFDCNPFKDYGGETYDAYDDFKRADFGFGLGANVWLAKHFEVSLGYEWGVCEVWSEKVIADSPHNRNLYMNLAFLF